MILCTAPREVPARLAEICAPGTLYLLLVITESLDVALHHTTKEVVIKNSSVFGEEVWDGFDVGNKKQSFFCDI